MTLCQNALKCINNLKIFSNWPIFQLHQTLNIGVFSSLYSPSLLHLSPPHVDQIAGSDHCPISPFLKSLGRAIRLNITIWVSPPHKCGQGVSCGAFNAVVAAFFQIFLSFALSYSLLMLILTSKIVWCVVPDGKLNF